MDTGYPALISEPEPHDLRKNDEGPRKKSNGVEIRHAVLDHDDSHEET